MQKNDLDNDAMQEVKEIIDTSKVAMFTTFSEQGQRLTSRPLHTRYIDFDGTLWFFTDITTQKVSAIQDSPQVNLAYANASNGIYLSISGQAEVVHDQEKIDELWIESIDSLFFKNGKTDPNLVLIRVQCEIVELWTSSSTSIGRIFRFLTAKATGNIHTLGEHKHLDLR